MTNKDTGAVTESILIGRATGNVGAELVKQLAAPGKRVKGSRKEQGQGCQHQAFGTTCVRRSHDACNLGTGIQKRRVRFCSCTSGGEAEETMERNAFNAAVEAGVKRIVYPSNYGATLGDGYPKMEHPESTLLS